MSRSRVFYNFDLTFTNRELEDEFSGHLMRRRRQFPHWEVLRALIALSSMLRTTLRLADIPMHVLSIYPIASVALADAYLALTCRGSWRFRAAFSTFSNVANIALVAYNHMAIFTYNDSMSALQRLSLLVLGSPLFILQTGRIMRLPFWVEYLRLMLGSLLAMTQMPAMCVGNPLLQWFTQLQLRGLGSLLTPPPQLIIKPGSSPSTPMHTFCVIQQSLLIIFLGFAWPLYFCFMQERRQRRAWKRSREHRMAVWRRRRGIMLDDWTDGDEEGEVACGMRRVGVIDFFSRFAVPGVACMLYFAAQAAARHPISYFT